MQIKGQSNDDPITELVNQGTSRYSLQHSMSEIINYNSERTYRLPWVCNIPRSANDKYIYISVEMRLDQLATKYYKDPKLWWVIAQVNGIQNPFTEFVVNRLIRIPSLTSLIQNGVTR